MRAAASRTYGGMSSNRPWRKARTSSAISSSGSPRALAGSRMAERGPKVTWLATMAGVAGVLLEHVLQGLVPLVPGKVHVDVGRILPAPVEEALEKEGVAQRVHVGEAQQVGDDAGGGAAPAAGPGALLHDVAHHEEVGGEPLLPDDGKLVVQALADVGPHAPVSPLHPGLAEAEQLAEGLLLRVPVEGREDVVRADDAGGVRLPGDLLRAGERLRHRGEEARMGLRLHEAMRFRAAPIPSSSSAGTCSRVVFRSMARSRGYSLSSPSSKNTVSCTAAAGRPRSRAKPARAEKGRP